MKIKNIQHAVKYGTFLQTLLWQYINKIPGFTLEPYYVYEEGIFGSNEPEWGAHLIDYETEFVTKEYMQEISSYGGQAEASLVKILENGGKCFVVKHNNQIAGYTLCDFDYFNHEPSYSKLNKNEVYLYSAFVAKPYRGKKLSTIYEISML